MEQLHVLSKRVDDRISEIQAEIDYIIQCGDIEYLELAKLQIAKREQLLIKSEIIELL